MTINKRVNVATCSDNLIITCKTCGSFTTARNMWETTSYQADLMSGLCVFCETCDVEYTIGGMAYHEY